MSILIILSFFSLTVTFLFWLFLLTREKKSKSSKILIFTLLMVFFWIFFDLLADIGIFKNNFNLFFWKVSSAFSKIFSLSVLYFICELTSKGCGMMGKKISRVILYSFLFFVLILIPFELFTDKIIYANDPRVYWWGSARFLTGELFFVSALVISLPLLLSLIFSLREYFKLTPGKSRTQLGYIVLGLAIPIVLGVVTDLIFPFLGINFIPLADFLIIFPVLFFTYAIYQWGAIGISLKKLKIKNKILIPIFSITLIMSIPAGIVLYKYSSEYIGIEINRFLDNFSSRESEKVVYYMQSRKDDIESLAVSPLIHGFFSSESRDKSDELITETRKKAVDVAVEISEYLKENPQLTLLDLQKNSDFQEIAVQLIGEEGYTAVTDYDSLVARFHKNSSTIDLDLHLLANKLPGFWSIMSKTEGGKRSDGFYDWLDPDGSLKQKYMDIEIVDRRTSDGVGLSVAATTYLDEYSYSESNFDSMLAYLKEYKKVHNYLDILLIDNEGDIIFSTENKISYNENLGSASLKNSNLQVVFNKAREGNAFSFSDIIIDYDDIIVKSPYIASAIHDRNSNEFLGVLALEVDLDKISNLIFKANEEIDKKMVNVYLVGRDLIVRARSEIDRNRNSFNESDNENLRKCLMDPYLTEDGIKEDYGHIVKFLDEKGEVRLGSHHYIPKYDWCVLVEISNKEASQSAIRLLEIVLTGGVFYFIFFYLIISFIARQISRPINKLQSDIENIEKEGLYRKVEIISKDEIGQLSQAFNKMIEAVKRSRRELNYRVEKQTREIKEKAEEMENQQKAIMNILEDVEEEKEKTQEEKEKMYTILHSIGDGVFVVDKSLRVVLTNYMVEKISGFSSGEIMGKKYHEVLNFIRESDRSKIKNDFIDDAMGKKKIQKMPSNTMLVKKNGEVIPVADSAAPLRDKNGRVVGCVVVFRDITKEHQIDKAKTEFVSLASHQLRTPLSAINWYAEMLLSGDAGNLSEDQKAFVNEIYIGNQRMVELVNALLNVSRIELGTLAIDPKMVSFKEISGDVVKELKNEIKSKKIKIKEDYSSVLPKIKADPNLSRIILQNIITNAVKYTPTGGKIEVLLKKDKKNLLIRVSDSGYGIPKNQQDKIFQKLFRADNVRKKDTGGTGLGLYLVKAILEQSGGRIWFESEKNKGTKFFVHIPLSGMKKKEGSKTLN